MERRQTVRRKMERKLKMMSHFEKIQAKTMSKLERRQIVRRKMERDLKTKSYLRTKRTGTNLAVALPNRWSRDI